MGRHGARGGSDGHGAKHTTRLAPVYREVGTKHLKQQTVPNTFEGSVLGEEGCPFFLPLFRGQELGTFWVAL